MKFVKDGDVEWQEKIGYSKKIFMTGDDINFPGALVQKIKIKAGEIAESHYHKKQTEMFYFFDDCGYWIVNGEKIRPKVGDFIGNSAEG